MAEYSRRRDHSASPGALAYLAAHRAELGIESEQVLVISEPAEAAGRGGEGGGTDLGRRSGLALLFLWAQVGRLATVYLPTGEEFGGPAEREVVYAHLWHRFGLPVVVAGTAVNPDNTSDAVTALLRPLAEAAVALSMLLVAHDYGPVSGQRRDERYAKARIRELRARPMTFDAIARTLQDEAVPTRKRVGEWSAPSVRELSLRPDAEVGGHEPVVEARP